MSIPKQRTVPMTNVKLPRYAGKALKAGDPFEATVKDAKMLAAAKLATYGTRDQARRPKTVRAPSPAPTATADTAELADLRARYEQLAGKKPHNFLKADKLKAAIAELEKAEDAALHGDSVSAPTVGDTPDA